MQETDFYSSEPHSTSDKLMCDTKTWYYKQVKSCSNEFQDSKTFGANLKSRPFGFEGHFVYNC